MSLLTSDAPAVVFHVPTKPYSAVDALNRIAAATGSVGYAMASAGADYNGHHLGMYWNNYRQYYVCDYNWGERVVIARGDARHVLQSSLQTFERQGRGASLRISVKENDAAIVREFSQVLEGAQDLEACKWYTWRHKNAANALWLEKHLGISSATLLCARDEEDYKFLTSHEGRADIKNRKPLPEALGVQA